MSAGKLHLTRIDTVQVRNKNKGVGRREKVNDSPSRLLFFSINTPIILWKRVKGFVVQMLRNYSRDWSTNSAKKILKHASAAGMNSTGRFPIQYLD